MRARWALVVVAALLAGCSGSDEEDAAEPVRVYLDALATGDGERACDQIAGNAQREMVGYAADLLPEFQITTCADAIEK